MAGTLKRIQDLFRRGDVVVLEAENGETVTVFVNKLNSLERDEAVKDGRQARALRMLSFDRNENEQAQLDVLIADMADEQLIEDLLRRRAGELLLKADDEVRSQPEWKEKIEALDRAQITAEGLASSHERQLITDLALEYEAAVSALHQKLQRGELRELRATSRAELVKSYRRVWREMLGSTAFVEAKRQSEIWYALRDCEVELDDDNAPILETLKVGARICPERVDVNSLPDEIVARVVAALDGEMSSREAGNSDAPSASSGSSELRSVEAASMPSTPTEI